MILWMVLFALVVAISFVLAAQSMRDFTETPSSEGLYGLFLIRNTRGLTETLLTFLKDELAESKSILSLERLFKGGKSALVLFGPKSIILNHKTALDLLELEEYSHNISPDDVFAWEVGVKKGGKITQKIFTHLSHFQAEEQFFWQVILNAHFKPQITAVFVSKAQSKTAEAAKLYHLGTSALHKLPKAYSNAQLLQFYQTRTLKKEIKNHTLTEAEILNLVQL